MHKMYYMFYASFISAIDRAWGLCFNGHVYKTSGGFLFLMNPDF